VASVAGMGSLVYGVGDYRTVHSLSFKKSKYSESVVH
jgi:hypothetical protein